MSAGVRADRRRGDLVVSVVIPVYNEAHVLEHLLASLLGALGELGCRGELIFVNDGSSDESGAILDRLAARHPEVRILHLSRNFGHQASIQAGLSRARGDVVVVMDADLQDDPASIGLFLARWSEGFDVVYGIRTMRKEGVLKRALFASFYRVFRLMSRVPMPLDAGSFGLVDGKVARQIAALGERDRYYPGLRSWVGYRQVGVPLERGARYDGRPRVRVSELWRLATSAIVSFSYLPFTVFYGIALIAACVFIGLGAFTVYHKLVSGLAVLGWTSTVMTACFFGAINALGIAILGEYVLRIYDQVRARPVFIVARSVNFADDAEASVPPHGLGVAPAARHRE